MTNQANDTQKPNDQAGQPGIDLTKYVPKEDYTKLNEQVASLKKELDDAKLNLLEPSYIEYLDSKKSKQVTQKDVDAAKALGLPKEAVDYLEGLKGELLTTKQAVAQLSAVIEYNQVKEEFKDFETYKEDVVKLLEADRTGGLTIRAAYLQAKGAKPVTQDTVPPKGNERPGQTVPSPESQKTFKNSYEAGQDAINQVRSKYNLSGDTI